MSAPLKALTIWQPWSSLIMIGAKPYEFRSWLPPKSLVGQRIVNHAAARKMRLDEVEDLIARLSDPEMAWTTCLRPDIALPFLKGVQGALRMGQQPLPLGFGLGTATVGTPVTGARAAKDFGCPDLINNSDSAFTNWGWPMLDIERWDEPVPMTGKQGLWNWQTPGEMGL